MVIISNNGKLSYLQKTEKYDYKKVIAYLNKLKKKHIKNISIKGLRKASLDLVKEFLKSAKKHGIHYNKGRR